MEVAWVNFLTEFMVYSVIKARGIHDGIVRASRKVSGEVLDTLENAAYGTVA